MFLNPCIFNLKEKKVERKINKRDGIKSGCEINNGRNK